MTQGELEPTAAFQARVLQGRALAEGGNLEAAEAHFRSLLDETRDGHPGNHARALSSLITVYGRAGRYLEAYLLARRLAGLAQEQGVEAEGTLAFAHGAICGALSQLRLVEPLERALEDMRTLLAKRPDPRIELELEYREAAAGHAVAIGDALTARQHLRAFEDALERRGRQPLDRWVLAMYEAHIAFIEGHADIAQRQLAKLESGDLTPPFHRLQELPLSVAVYAAIGQQEQARRRAREAIAILASAQNEPFLVSDRIHQGTRLIRELERLAELDLAQRVYDLVAAAVMIRLKQVEACVRDLPELGLADAESTAALAGFRKQFLQEQRTLLRRVADLLASRGAEHVRSLLNAPGGLVAVCAWCESVRPAEGRWLPIGHFIPRDGSLQLTHSICPKCAETWET